MALNGGPTGPADCDLMRVEALKTFARPYQSRLGFTRVRTGELRTFPAIAGGCGACEDPKLPIDFRECAGLKAQGSWWLLTLPSTRH